MLLVAAAAIAAASVPISSQSGIATWTCCIHMTCPPVCPGDIDIEEEAEAGNATVNITNQTEVANVVVEEEAGNATMTAGTTNQTANGNMTGTNSTS